MKSTILGGNDTCLPPIAVHLNVNMMFEALFKTSPFCLVANPSAHW